MVEHQARDLEVQGSNSSPSSKIGSTEAKTSVLITNCEKTFKVSVT